MRFFEGFGPTVELAGHTDPGRRIMLADPTGPAERQHSNLGEI